MKLKALQFVRHSQQRQLRCNVKWKLSQIKDVMKCERMILERQNVINELKLMQVKPISLKQGETMATEIVTMTSCRNATLTGEVAVAFK